MWRRDPSALLGISAHGSDATQTPLKFVGDLTAGDPPVPIPNTAVKPRRADCTARESVWESTASPALNKGRSWKPGRPFPLVYSMVNVARVPSPAKVVLGLELRVHPQPAIIFRLLNQPCLYRILSDVFAFLLQTLIRPQHMIDGFIFPDRIGRLKQR